VTGMRPASFFVFIAGPSAALTGKTVHAQVPTAAAAIRNDRGSSATFPLPFEKKTQIILILGVFIPLRVCKLVYEGVRLRNNCTSSFYYYYH
jgi:hypothetical protein